MKARIIWPRSVPAATPSGPDVRRDQATQEEGPDQRSQDSDQDVPQQSVAVAAHHVAGEKTSYQAHQDGDQEMIHESLQAQ
jgi:hypothetical protein